MKLNKKLNLNKLQTRIGYFVLLIVLLWAKTMFAYLVDFHLGIESLFQYFILFINPFATATLLLSIGLYVKNPKRAYWTTTLIYIAMSILLFSNVVYYREFTDFITINTMLGAGKVASGLGESALRLFRPYDLLYLIDFPILGVLFWKKKINVDEQPIRFRLAFAITSLSVLMFSINLSLAEADRPQLLKRTFSKDYIVKYLGINAFTAYDGLQTYQANQNRAQASENDLVSIEEYVSHHQTPPNEKMFGVAKGKNVIYVHLESLQQFMIGYHLVDENGVSHEVTPFLNSLFNDQATYSFDNVFHQVKSGKTSDAETLLENSFFGLDQGPLFTQLGNKNTFQAAPAILGQEAGYTSAVFHGNAGTFWNRNETYKHLGYDYFFDGSYYDVNEDNSFQYGLHDKPFFQQSTQYLEHLQQPFYTKFIAVSNHYPYSEFKDGDAGFPMANTKDTTINGYFATANYLDKAVEEFFNYLKASGLYENSMIVLYGDHYGISDSRNVELAELLDKSPSLWGPYDNAQLQRVPLMFHIPGQTEGFVNHTFGGQVDVLPTLLHLLGIDSNKYLMLGQDLFSPENSQIVTFRNGDIMTPEYTIIGDNAYLNKTGQMILEPTEEQTAQIEQIREAGQQQLQTSDALTNGDLLRYYTNSNLEPVKPDSYNYKNQVERLEKIEKEKGKNSTSVYSQHNNQSTVDLYESKTYQEYFGKPDVASEETSSDNE
ncbi:LTA synthase family protein [Vagococcus lutrae]|nr:LTA synthase family protein [Vagococcus lutrae]MDT2823786.1 LTA synthase family protein [Vagococcus lutrae]